MDVGLVFRGLQEKMSFGKDFKKLVVYPVLEVAQVMCKSYNVHIASCLEGITSQRNVQ